MIINKERKSSIAARLLVYPIRAFLRLILLTCKYKVTGAEHLHKSAKNGSTIIMLWHDKLVLIGPSLLEVAKDLTFCAFISNSKDGDIIAEYTNSYSIGRTIRVPHDSRDQALKMLITRLKLKRDVVIMTPDGPRGPRHEIKPGIAIAAKETNANIIPFSWTSDKYWELKSWDKMRIPKPFSKINASFCPPLRLEKGAPIENDLVFLKNQLSDICSISN